MKWSLSRIARELSSPKIAWRKALHRIPFDKLKIHLLGFPSEESILVNMKQLIQSSRDATVFVFPGPSCPWGYLFQRPQQIARTLAGKGYKVIYVTDTSYPHDPDWGVRGFNEIEPNVWLFNDGLGGHLLSRLEGRSMVIWQYWPHQWELVRDICEGSEADVKHVYDCIDDLTAFDQYPEIYNDHAASLRNANMVLATSRILLTEIQVTRPDAVLVQNGVNPQDFQMATMKKVDSSGSARPVVGYYGAIASWFDFDLVRFLAQARRDWDFIVVGPVYESVAKQVEILACEKNVKVQGRVAYGEIPRLLSTFDVAILPFLINEITLRTSPVKIYEYLAGGRPPVCTDLPEVRDIPHVRRASTPQEFLVEIEKSLSFASSPDSFLKMICVAAENSWDSRVDNVLFILGFGGSASG